MVLSIGANPSNVGKANTGSEVIKIINASHQGLFFCCIISIFS